MQSGKYSRTQRESVKLPEHMGARTASGTSLHSTRAMLSLSAVGAGDALGVVTSTHSNSQSMPSGSSTAATSSRVPAAIMVGVNVAPSRGSTSAATSGSSRRSSAPAARAVCGSLRRTHRSASLTTASINCAVSGETMAGGSYRPSATTARARSMTALRSFSGTEARPRHCLGGHLVLHVGGAAAPHVAVLHEAAEGRHAPFGGVGRDHVHVAHVRQCGAGAGAVEARDEVLPRRRLADESALDAVARQVVLEDERAGGLVAGWVGGVDAQKGGEEVDDFALKSVPVVGLETVQRHRHHPWPRGKGTHLRP